MWQFILNYHQVCSNPQFCEAGSIIYHGSNLGNGSNRNGSNILQSIKFAILKNVCVCVHFSKVVHFDAACFAPLNPLILPITLKCFKSFICVCRNQSSEMENLPNISFYHLPFTTPLSCGIELAGPRADDILDGFMPCFFCKTEPPQLCLGCCVSMLDSLLRN